MLRPQPWAGGNATPTELLLEWTCYALGTMPIKSGLSPNPIFFTSINPKPVSQPYIHHNYQPQTNHPPPHPSQASTPKPIGNPTSITSINYKPITQPHIHHKHQPQTNHRIYICSYKTNTDIADLSDILGKCYQANQRYPYFHQYRPRGNRANPYATPEALYRGIPPWRR